MSLKILCILLLIVIVFVDRDDTFVLRSRYIRSYSRRDHNPCPKSSKIVSPEISFSPFLVGSDAPGHVNTEKQPLVVIPVSTRMFKKLEMGVLPSREVCVLGEKLDNLILPPDFDSQFEVMTGIAIWFSPCVSAPTHEKRMDCFTEKTKEIGALNISQFKTLYQLVKNMFFPKDHHIKI